MALWLWYMVVKKDTLLWRANIKNQGKEKLWRRWSKSGATCKCKLRELQIELGKYKVNRGEVDCKIILMTSELI